MRENTEPAPSTAKIIGRGVLAGIAGTFVMTAFQKLVEMPLTGRRDSYAPADFAQRILPVRARSPRARTNLNYVTHFSLGAMWGAAYGVAAARGLRGHTAVSAVYATVYTGDVILNTALGVYHPTRWSTQDWVVDTVDKYVQALATGAIFDRFLDPAVSRAVPR